MAETETLGWVDYMVIFLMLCISIGIGIYYRFSGGRQKTVEEYFNASQSMSVIPVSIALVVSFMSAITLLGVSAENYYYGTQFVVINLSYLIGTPIVCYGFLPVFFKLRATSAYEYLEKRFGVKTRMMASFVYWVQLLLYSGVVLYAPSLALEATTGISKAGSIIIIGLACSFYSSIGGIKAVLITDVFQSVLMFASVLIIIIIASCEIGGLDKIWDIAVMGQRIEFDNTSIYPTERHTWWSLIFGGLATFLSLYGVNQVQVQRMLTVKSLKSAQLSMWLSLPILMFLSVSTCLSGLSMYSKYYDCDPLTEGRISIIDMLMPLYVMDTMHSLPGLPGLFIAGIFSAGLSTISAALNSLSAVTLEDYIKPAYNHCTNKELSPTSLATIGKMMAFAYGLISIALAFLAELLGGVLQAGLTIFGIVGGPLLGIFTLGMATESAMESGAISGAIISLVFLFWIAYGQPRPIPIKLPLSTSGCNIDSVKNITLSAFQSSMELSAPKIDNNHYFYLYRISYMWYAPLGFLITFIIGLLISNIIRCISKKTQKELDPDLFFPIIGKRLSNKRSLRFEHNELADSNKKLQGKYVVNVESVDEGELISSSTFYGFFAKRQETSEDFLLGGSTMGTFPMAMSLAASFITAIELLGNPAEMYAQGTQFWMTCLAFILVVPITSYLYLPVYMKLRLTSSYEYLNLRFNRHCRLLASGLYMLQMIFYTSVAVYAPALALSHVTGLNTYIAVTLVYFVCIFYASQGGMKAVIMADTFQAAVLLGSLFLIAGLGVSWAGGSSLVWEDNRISGRIEVFNMDPSPTVRHSFWSVVIGGTFYWTSMYCSNQASVQKYLSVSSISQARTALWVSSFGMIIIYTINFLTGMVLYSVYKDCDPLSAHYISGSDQILPLYVMNFLGSLRGMPGFFVAGIFAASLGTVASALNSLAAITCEDILQGLFKMELPARKGAIYARWISIFFGILSFALVFVVEQLGSVLQVALSFNGMVGGVTLGLFSLGMFVPWANAKGAMLGAITSLLIVLWIGLGTQLAIFNGHINLENKPLSTKGCLCFNDTAEPTIALTSFTEENNDYEISSIYRTSYLWYSAIGCILTLVVGFMISLLTGLQNPAELDQDLLSPPVAAIIRLRSKKRTNRMNVQGVANFGLELDDEKVDTRKNPK
ncbi:hypothetical protein M0802_007502 [Mischocyttarus mexicanus]|nr:hypothetical protein M0802_007502 [Mischocyttarus mexicanus]